MSVRIQELIHQFEEGGSSRFFRYVLAVIVMLAVAVCYNLTCFRNLSSLEGMDSAQLARNLAEGRGYTTLFIRPFSLHLVERHRTDHDPLIREAHPDLANPPLYPGLLALALKLMPFEYPDVSTGTSFSIYLPDLWIALFNQLLFLVAVGMVFRLARRLFDEPVAWLSAGVFLGTELFWRFTLSGHSTIASILILLGLAHVLARLEPAARERSRSRGWLIGLALLAGVLVGMACLTRYALGWLIVPLVIWLTACGGRDRAVLAASAAVAFLVVTIPWVARNYLASGAPFGTAGFAVCQNTSAFPEFQLERSLHPRFHTLTGTDFAHKFVVNAREMLATDLPKLGGNWLSAFFLVGLLMRFRNPTLGRLRYFALLSLAVLFVGQALGRTALTTESPGTSSENLLVVLAPLVFIFGASFFFVLLSQFEVSVASFRHFLLTFFVALVCAPLILAVLPPHPSPLAYPPYYPPWIQTKAHQAPEQGLVVSDVPWAVAWYGRRQSVWWPLKYRSRSATMDTEDFYAIYSRKPVQALYLSTKTAKSLETASVWRWIHGETQDQEWEDFLLGVLLKREVPTGFPLRVAPEGLAPEIFLTDSERGAEKTIQLK